jgi:pimeloyl-ACP methyl ester carboxylesterase
MKMQGSLGHSCYAPDMPGFGFSDESPVANPDVRYYTDLFMELFASIGVSEPFYVVGHHTGALLAVQMADLYPSSVRGICMVGPALLTASERAAFKTHTDADFDYNRPVLSGAHLLKTWEHLVESGFGTNLDICQRDGLDHMRAWRGRNQVYAAVWEYDCIAAFEKVKCRVLALCAEDDVLWQFLGKVRQVKPDAWVETVVGANHSPDQDPKGISKWLAKFIDEDKETISK